MMVLNSKVIAALERARKADHDRQKDGLTVRAEKRLNEAFSAATEVLFYLLDSDQTNA